MSSATWPCPLLRTKPKPGAGHARPDDLLAELYSATLAALRAADRPGTHIQKTDNFKVAAAILRAALLRTAKYLGRIPPPRFARYQ